MNKKMTNKKNRIRVGSLNCRSLNKHKKQDLVDDMNRHKLLAIATQETKIRGKTSEFIMSRDKKTDTSIITLVQKRKKERIIIMVSES